MRFAQKYFSPRATQCQGFWRFFENFSTVSLAFPKKVLTLPRITKKLEMAFR